MFIKEKWRLKRHLCPAGYGESSVPRELKLWWSAREIGKISDIFFHEIINKYGELMGLLGDDLI